MTPDWSQLTIPLEEVEATRVLSFWSWLVDRPVRPVALTRFGDWFLLDERGSVARLDILEGSFGPICDSLATYEKAKAGEAALADWFQDGMVDAMYRSGAVPPPGHGFGYRAPPVIGGSLARDNVIVVAMPGWQWFMSRLHLKLRELPPGARVRRLALDDRGELTIECDNQ